MTEKRKNEKKKEIRPPAWWLILLLYPIAWLFAKLAIRWRCHKEEGVDELEGPVVCIGTHTFAGDVLLMLLAMLPRYRLNIVCGRDVFSWKPVKPIRRAAGLIPINQCAMDLGSIRSMLGAVKAGCSLAVFPEGKISIDGRELPNLGVSTAKFLKMLSRPVLFFHNNGGYSTRPRWFKALKRGRVEQEIKVLFKKEELDSLSVEEIYQRLRAAFTFNDNAWAEEHNVAFKSRNPAKGLHYILYRCPVCGKEYEMETEGKFLRCRACAYEVEMLPTGKLVATEGKTIYDRLDKWYDMEIEEIRKDIAREDFSVEYPVVWEECDDDFVYREMGEGILRIDHDEIAFYGSYYPKEEGGEHVDAVRRVSLKSINTVVQKPREAIDLTVGSRVNRFYFKDCKYSAKVNLYVQELHARLL